LDKYFKDMKILVKGDEKAPPSEENIVAFVQAVLTDDLIVAIVENLNVLSFEAKKYFSHVVFPHMMHREVGNKNVTVEYLQKNVMILDKLVGGYEKTSEVAKTSGQMLRICIETDTLCKHLLDGNHYLKFFDYVENPHFDIASDAFATFKDMLTKHKNVCAQFLEKNYESFFSKYSSVLLKSNNYVTRRQSLKLLGELLLDRANFNVMTKYISERDNLVLMMNMLRDKSQNIQFEAFHVFKVFVANPNKAEPILKILVRNKEKLIQFLTEFNSEKASDDEQFADEKAFLLKQIELLPSKV